MSFKDISERFGVQFQRGSRVYCEGRLGTITGATHSHIRVRFDGRQTGAPCDPLDIRLVESVSNSGLGHPDTSRSPPLNPLQHASP